MYLISWTGGGSEPQYAVKGNLDDAIETWNSWKPDTDEGDWLAIYEINTDDMSIRATSFTFIHSDGE